MSRRQRYGITSNIEVCRTVECDVETSTGPGALFTIIEADRSGIVEEEMSIDLGNTKA